MTDIVLPDVRDAESIAADYFDLFARKPYTLEERERIIGACIQSLVLVIIAGASVNEGNEIGLRIFAAFLRDLSLQVCPHTSGIFDSKL